MKPRFTLTLGLLFFCLCLTPLCLLRAEEGKTKEPEQLKVLIEYFGNDEETKMIADEALVFNALHSDTGFTFEIEKAFDYEIDLLAAIESGEAPDIFIDQHRLQTRINRGDVLDLTELIEARGMDLDDFAPVALRSVKSGDRVFALPYSYTTQALCLNLPKLKDIGYAPPSNPAWTFDEFMSLCQQYQTQITDEGALSIPFASHHTLSVYANFLQQGSISIMRAGDLGIETDLGNPEALGILQRLRDPSIDFYDGQTFYFVTGTGLPAMFTASTDDWTENEMNVLDEGLIAYMPFPTITEGGTGSVRVRSYCISSQTEQADLCFDFLRRLTDTDSVISSWGENIPRTVPARLSAQKQYLTHFPKTDLRAILALANEGTAYQASLDDEASDFIYDTLVATVSPEEGIDPDAVFSEGVSEFQALLSES